MGNKERFILTALVLFLAVSLAGCGQKEVSSSSRGESESALQEETEETREEEETKESAKAEEETIPPEQMDLIKYNYYVDLNNDIVEILDSAGYYFEVVDYAEEFSLLPDTGLTYGYRVYGANSDIIDDCLQLAEMDPDYGELDGMVKEMAEPLRELMDTFLAISRSSDYADNQYQKAKEYHAIIYAAVDVFAPLGYAYMDAISEMGDARIAAEEEKMKAEGELIAYNASRGITIGRQVLKEISEQGITDESITELDLTKIRALYEELVAVVGELDAATADNDQLIKESLSNSRPFDGLYGALIQALEWMIMQVESGKPVDLSGSGAPLGSIGHFSETLSKCIERYNTVFVE